MTTQLERDRAWWAIPRPRVWIRPSHLLINCVVGAALWAGLIALMRWALA